jgi:hypothetical protein
LDPTPVVWTNDTTRATALVLQDGVLVKSGTPGDRYLGTFRTTGTTGQCEDSATKRYVWNYYNRVRRAVRVFEATASWNYTTAAWQQANASTANQIGVVCGTTEDVLSLEALAVASNSSTDVAVATGIALDGVNPMDSLCLVPVAYTPKASARVALVARRDVLVAAGYHYYTWCEYSAATGTTTWYGTDSATMQAGLSGVWMA